MGSRQKKTGLEKRPPKKVDVIPYDVVGRHNKIVLFHLMLQPEDRGNVQTPQSRTGPAEDRTTHRMRSVGGPV